MTKSALALLGFLVAVPAGGSAALAQETPPAAKDPPLRDPTVPVPGVGAGEAPAATARPADAADALPAMPALALRGLVVVKGRPGAAVLDVAGTLHHVTQGSQVTHVDATGRPLVLSVTAVSADEVRVSIAPIAQTVVLR